MYLPLSKLFLLIFFFSSLDVLLTYIGISYFESKELNPLGFNIFSILFLYLFLGLYFYLIKYKKIQGKIFSILFLIGLISKIYLVINSLIIILQNTMILLLPQVLLEQVVKHLLDRHLF